MASTPRTTRRNDHRLRDITLITGIGLILLFAVIGLVSTGLMAGRALTMSAPSHRVAVRTVPAGRSASLAHARTRATAIVRSAEARGRSIQSRAVRQAHAQAAAIIVRARRQAARIKAAAQSTSPAPVSAAPAVPVPTSVSPAVTVPSAASPQSPTSSGTPSTAPVGASSTPPADTTASPPSLAGVPSGWYVVAYNATFGAGPGSAGSISVTNRGQKTYTGTARVIYTHGGEAVASFTVSPGQTVTLPLNGPAYPGGGYRIVVSV